jgi:hypothetical protein
MPVSLASELWGELKRYISTVDREEAADVVVNILIDNDIDVDEIKANFKGDSEIKHALSQYTEDIDEEIEEEYEDDDNY